MNSPSPSPYDSMQAAVDIVAQSEHLANKIAATITGQDARGAPYSLSFTNYWPDGIREKIGMETRIGNASGTIHAETACLIRAPMTRGASLFVTDPPCPNCIKNLAEAGGRALYIDHKGFDKDFAQRRAVDFTTLSLHMCEKAGIDVYRIYRKEKRAEAIFTRPADYKPPIENPARIEKIENIDEAAFHECIEQTSDIYKNKSFALCLARSVDGECFLIAADPHPMPGFTTETLEETGEKYSLILQPLNRITMTAARRGFMIDRQSIFSSEVPTARAQVNMIGIGLHDITIRDLGRARDPSGPQALRQLQEAGLLRVKSYK